MPHDELCPCISVLSDFKFLSTLEELHGKTSRKPVLVLQRLSWCYFVSCFYLNGFFTGKRSEHVFNVMTWSFRFYFCNIKYLKNPVRHTNWWITSKDLIQCQNRDILFCLCDWDESNVWFLINSNQVLFCLSCTLNTLGSSLSISAFSYVQFIIWILLMQRINF